MAKNAVAVAEKSAPLAIVGGFDLEQFAGAGLQEVKATDMSIPFLRILAQLSPQVNKRDGAYVQGAEAGDIYHTVSNIAFKGDEGVKVVPCYMSHRYVEWKPREKGGGFVASHHADDPITKTTRRDDRGNEVLPTGNMLVNTYQFFVILLTEEGPQRCMIAMSSSQVTKAKKWITTMESQTMRGASGKLFTLPMFANIYHLKTVPQQNDKGSWYGWEIQKVGQVEDGDLLNMGMEFSKAVRAGEVTVKEDEGNEHSSHRDAVDLRADEIL
jgi:hypothetical protein